MHTTRSPDSTEPSFRQYTVDVGQWKRCSDGDALEVAKLRTKYEDWAARTRPTVSFEEMLRAWVRRGWLAEAGAGGYTLRATLWAMATAFHNGRSAA